MKKKDSGTEDIINRSQIELTTLTNLKILKSSHEIKTSCEVSKSKPKATTTKPKALQTRKTRGIWH